MDKPKKAWATRKRHSLESSANLTRARPSSRGSLSIVSLKTRRDRKNYLDKVLPHILQRMDKKANAKIVIRAMRELISAVAMKFGLEFKEKDQNFIDDTIESITLTILTPRETRNLSSFTDEEIWQLIPVANVGLISFDHDIIRQKLGKKAKADIYETTGMVLQKLESGCRMVIDCFFKRAVMIAREYHPGLVIAPEMQLKTTDLGISGFEEVNGRVDYATAISPYNDQTADMVRGHVYISYPAEEIVCCVCEAKHRGTINSPSSRAEAIGALLVLSKWKQENKSINGVLSDGKSWTFLRFHNNFLYMTEELPATTEAQQEIVLGLLTQWIVGAEIEILPGYSLRPRK